MKISLANTVAGTAADNTEVEMSGVTPFLLGRKVDYEFTTVGASGTAPVYHIEGSDDDSTYVELAEIITVGKNVGQVPVYKYMRTSVETAAGTAGTYSCVLTAEN